MDERHRPQFYPPANPTRIEDLLERIAKCREAFEHSEDDKERGRDAIMAFKWGMELMFEAVGVHTMAEVYGDDPPDDAPHSEHLLAVARRLMFARSLFPSERSSKSSIVKLSEDIEAVAHGDLPRVVVPLPGVQGRPINSYRLARHQLLALEWDITLREHLGMTAAQSHIAIANAYGAEWTAIARWKEPVARELGQDTLDSALAEARRFSWLAQLGDPPALLLEHGKQYQDELRRRVQAA